MRKRKSDKKDEAIQIIKENPNDKAKIKQYISTYPDILVYANEELFKDSKFCIEILLINGMALEYMPEEIQNNKEYVIMAIKSSGGFALKFASNELRADYEVVKNAILKYKKPLKYASEDLQMYYKEKWDKYYKTHHEREWGGYEIIYNGIRTPKEKMDEIYEKDKEKERKRKQKNSKKIDLDNVYKELEELMKEEQIKLNDYSFEEKDYEED